MEQTFYYPRELAARVIRALKTFPVVVVSGPRQSGKSTLLQNDPVFAGRPYLTLDDFNTLTALREEPESVLLADQVITLDEAQRCPEAFLAIKRLVDKDRRPGQFLLSGSANFLLLANLGDSLAGRACYLNLLPFSAREWQRKTEKPPFLLEVLDGVSPREAARDITLAFGPEDILRGGFPPPRLHPGEEYADWFLGYEQTYLERDVRQLSQVADLTAYRTLLRLAALRTAQVLNVSDLGRDAKLNAVTTGRYLSLQETSCLLHRLPAYQRSRSSRLVKAPKIHLADSGLAAYLCGVRELPPGGAEPLRGALLESYVAQNLTALLGAHRPEAQLFYWRERGGREVDFIVEDGQRALAVEVKWASRLQPDDWRGLAVFREQCPSCVAGLLAYSGEEVTPLGECLWAVPLPVLWS